MSDNTRKRTSRGRDGNRLREFVFLTDERQPGGRIDHRWWSQTGSNRRPPACKAGALPTELWPRTMGGLTTEARGELPRLRLSGFAGQPSHRVAKVGGPGKI
jgi:hypothetical protein